MIIDPNQIMNNEDRNGNPWPTIYFPHELEFPARVIQYGTSSRVVLCYGRIAYKYDPQGQMRTGWFCANFDFEFERWFVHDDKPHRENEVYCWMYFPPSLTMKEEAIFDFLKNM